MENLILEKKSRLDFSKTVDTIVKTATDRGWSNPAIHNMQESLAKSDKHVKPVKVIEICKPEFSGKMLELNDERIMSVMMPCRISVYEKNDGKTYVALLNGGLMTAGMPEIISKTMKAVADESIAIANTVCE